MFQLSGPDFFDSEQDAVRLIRRSPQIPYPLHNHDFSEMVLVLSGSGIHFTEDREYRVSTGDVFIIQGKTSHGYKDLDDLCLVNLLFKPDRLPLPFMDIHRIPGYQALFHLEPRYRDSHNFASRLHLTPTQLIKASALLDRIEEEYKQEAKGFGYMATVHFMELIGYLSRSYDHSESLENKELLRIARGISYLEHHMTDKLSLEDIIKETGMSASSLNRHFKRVTGASPLEYQIQLRIRKACSLLKKTDLNITEIAYRCGFDDSNYFSRQFRKICKQSPSTYRKLH